MCRFFKCWIALFEAQLRSEKCIGSDVELLEKCGAAAAAILDWDEVSITGPKSSFLGVFLGAMGIPWPGSYVRAHVYRRWY